MSVFLFALLDDEPLAGNAARYAECMGVTNWPEFTSGLFGYKAALSAAFPYNLDHVASETEHCWALTGEEIAVEATLFPYFASFASEDDYRLMRSLVLKRAPGRKPTFLMKALRSRRTLRYCHTCLAEDVNARRPLYWRRRHQLPGALYCDTHETRLCEFPFGPSVSMSWPTPPTATLESSVPVALEHRDAWLKVARTSTEVLARRKVVRAQDRLSDWLYVLHEGGFDVGGSRVAQSALRGAFVETFGAITLQALGLPLPKKNNWLKARLTSAQTAMAPLADVLIEVFCDLIRQRASGFGWPFCVNPLAAHGQRHPVEERVRRGARFFTKCGCGMSIAYSRVEEGVPQEFEVTVYGPTYRSEAEYLASMGLTAARVARRMGVPETNVRRWLEPLCPPARIGLSAGCLSLLNDEWEVLRRRCGSVRVASQKCNALYRVAKSSLGSPSTS